MNATSKLLFFSSSLAFFAALALSSLSFWVSTRDIVRSFGFGLIVLMLFDFRRKLNSLFFLLRISWMLFGVRLIFQFWSKELISFWYINLNADGLPSTLSFSLSLFLTPKSSCRRLEAEGEFSWSWRCLVLYIIITILSLYVCLYD